jgi:membrane protease YdiL (CAAX protease family)
MKNIFKTFGIVILSIIGMIILFIVVIGVGNYFQRIDQNLVGNIFMFLFPMSVYFAVRIFNKKVNRLNSETYGFGFRNFVGNTLQGIGLAIAIMAVVVLIAKMVFGIQVEFMGLKNDFQSPLLSLLATLVIVGIWEEFYFRGLLFNTFLKNDFGFHLSALFSSLLFSVIHWSSFDMTKTSWLWYLGIVFIGYIFVYIYTYTNSIWSVVFFHVAWNFIAELMDNNENKIGLFQISNYSEYSKTVDNITVVCLGLILGIILILTRKGKFFNKIKSFENKITTANSV